MRAAPARRGVGAQHVPGAASSERANTCHGAGSPPPGAALCWLRWRGKALLQTTLRKTKIPATQLSVQTAPHQETSRPASRETLHKEAAGALEPLLNSAYLTLSEIFAMLILPWQRVEPGGTEIERLLPASREGWRQAEHSGWEHFLHHLHQQLPPNEDKPSPSTYSKSSRALANRTINSTKAQKNNSLMRK